MWLIMSDNLKKEEHNNKIENFLELLIDKGSGRVLLSTSGRYLFIFRPGNYSIMIFRCWLNKFIG